MMSCLLVMDLKIITWEKQFASLATFILRFKLKFGLFSHKKKVNGLHAESHCSYDLCIIFLINYLLAVMRACTAAN